MAVSVSFDSSHQGRQVRKLQRDAARRLQPHQPRLGAQLADQVSRVHGVIHLMRDAPGGQLAIGKRLVRAVSVVGYQQFVTTLQKRHADQHHRRQTAGHQSAKLTAFERGNALFQQESGWRAVQAVGIAGFVLPVAGAQGSDVWEDDSGCPVDGGRHSLKACGWLVGVVDQCGGELGR